MSRNTTLPWKWKKQSIRGELEKVARRSRLLSVIGINELPDEVQSIVQYQHPTLVKDDADRIQLAGPVVVGIRYSQRMLSEAPHSMEIAAVFAPQGIHHPNCGPTGQICLGHPTPGLSMEQILHQVWALIAWNMRSVNIRPGEYINREAALYFLAHRAEFPLTEAGLYEADPVPCPPPSPRHVHPAVP